MKLQFIINKFCHLFILYKYYENVDSLWEVLEGVVRHNPFAGIKIVEENISTNKILNHLVNPFERYHLLRRTVISQSIQKRYKTDLVIGKDILPHPLRKGYINILEVVICYTIRLTLA